MDPQFLFNIAIGCILAVGGWFARELWGAVKELRENVHKLELDLPINYIRKDEFREGIKELKDLIGEVFRKIDDLRDKKADK
jgi:hypothetical protein